MSKNKLETLVPPLDLCKKIQECAFEDSALVWRYDHDIEQYIVCVRCPYSDKQIPAPTLEEIMAAMARMEVCPGVDMLVNIKGEICGRVDAGMRNVSFCGKSTPAEAALKRWLELKGEGEK